MIDLEDVEATIKNKRVVVTTNDGGDTLTGYLTGKTEEKGEVHLIFRDKHGEEVKGPPSRFSYYPTLVG